jgi:hypothetical protein
LLVSPTRSGGAILSRLGITGYVNQRLSKRILVAGAEEQDLSFREVRADRRKVSADDRNAQRHVLEELR